MSLMEMLEKLYSSFRGDYIIDLEGKSIFFCVSSKEIESKDFRENIWNII